MLLDQVMAILCLIPVSKIKILCYTAGVERRSLTINKTSTNGLLCSPAFALTSSGTATMTRALMCLY